MIQRDLLSLSSEVEAALALRRPVVALESTVIAHGLPHPQNLETARQLEQIIREAAVVPATIAVLKGKIHVGLSDDQLRFVAYSEKGSEQIKKLSIRDLPV